MLEAVERKIEQYIEDLNDKDSLMLYRRVPAGKRLRAKLVLAIAGNSLASIKTASVIEMIHTASLLHDDVIDDAYTRRGKPSINALFGNKTSIMFGDVLYSKGFYELIDIDKNIAKVISNAVVRLSIGERQDVILSQSFNDNIDRYKEMIYLKTASLIEASSEAGAILAGKDREIYRRYGKNLGLAFQMIDDILDITQDSKTLGKPSMHDFKEGKTTLPYIYLYESLNTPDREKLVSMHSRDLSEDEISWLKEQMQKSRALDRAKAEAKELAQEAVELMRSEGNKALERVALEMVERSF